MIGAGQGLSYEATARDLSETTYSSARQGLIEDGMTYAEDDELLRDVMDEIYETFVISAVLAGAVNIRDFWENKDKYFVHDWVKPPKPWIDPNKEAMANQVAMRSGAKTFQQIAAENGQDWKQMVDQTCEVLKYARERHGVDLGGVILGQKKSDGLYEKEEAPEAGDQQSAPSSEEGDGADQGGDGQDDGAEE
jgi:capsid protein